MCAADNTDVSLISQHDICICIPIYKCSMHLWEEASFVNTVNILHNYDIFIVASQSLDCQQYVKFKSSLNIERFDDSFFQSTLTYSRLCMYHKFYERFERYEYMLICQLDAYVFYDELIRFAQCGYDYIGAPWCQGCNSCKENFNTSKLVGNGGFSLRKIHSFINALKSININDVNENEDVFLKKFNLNIAPCSVAMKFSVESNANSLILMNNKLPMGFHNLRKINYPLYCMLMRLINKQSLQV